MYDLEMNILIFNDFLHELFQKTWRIMQLRKSPLQISMFAITFVQCTTDKDISWPESTCWSDLFLESLSAADVASSSSPWSCGIAVLAARVAPRRRRTQAASARRLPQRGALGRSRPNGVCQLAAVTFGVRFLVRLSVLGSIVLPWLFLRGRTDCTGGGVEF